MSQNYTDINTHLVINDMSEAQFNNLQSVDSNQIYLTEDESANQDLSNISNAGKIVAASASMPSQTTISLTLGASGTSYTMPADGWLHVTLALNINGFLSVGAVYTQSGTANGGYASVFRPVRKGEKLSIAYEQKASVVRFQFIYAKGSESEAS